MTQAPTRSNYAPTEGEVWQLLLELAELARRGRPVASAAGLCLDVRGQLGPAPSELGWLEADKLEGARTLQSRRGELDGLLELYLPLCIGPSAGAFVLGHLGQSLDGQIAIASGASRYVTGPENLRHMHRLRALSDAVLVGVSTVEFDNPKLTTRLVAGKSPVRVVLDPELRAPKACSVFVDQAAPTLLFTSTSAERRVETPSGPDLVRVPMVDGVLSVTAIVGELARRGLKRVFVEGGGITVSHFLVAGALTRLHITVSPVFLGAGRPGIVVPPIFEIEQALRPKARHYGFGQDVLFDFDLAAPTSPSQRVVKRV